MIASISHVKEVMKDLRAKKKFGQNFLIDARVPEKIVAAAGITGGDLVLEIGPGIGTMTQRLCEAAAKVVAIEIDKEHNLYLRGNVEDVAKATVEIIYRLRCLLLHGEIDPTVANSRIYEHAYGVLRTLIKELR
mgnify:CR=1 FL=1